MPSTNADFQARWKKEVVLPSGLSVDIRKIQSWDFIGLGDLPLPAAGEPVPGAGTMEQAIERVTTLRQYTQRAIAKGVIAPKMTDDEAQHGPDAFYVGYLEADDAEVLALAIMEWAGLSKEAAGAVDAFREDAVRPADQSDERAVWGAPLRPDAVLS